MVDRFFLRRAHAVIAVDGATGKAMRLKRPPLIHHGFIPPSPEREPALPAQVQRWLEEKRGRGRKIFTANAWRLDLCRGADLYGLDLCIELARRLAAKKAGAAFIFAVSSPDRRSRRLNLYGERIRESGLQDCFLLQQGPLSFTRLIQEAHFVLRPTRADGDSLTVREALFLGKPIIASDAAARPPGAVLFRSGDIEDLLAKALAVMEPGAAAEENTAETGSPLAFYRGLYARAGG
jgi:glycosyltransferase involved in cell wall biosynthesis